MYEGKWRNGPRDSCRPRRHDIRRMEDDDTGTLEVAVPPLTILGNGSNMLERHQLDSPTWS